MKRLLPLLLAVLLLLALPACSGDLRPVDVPEIGLRAYLPRGWSWEVQTGYRPGAYEATIGEDGLIAIRLYDDMGDRESTVTWYYIDRYTAMGEDLIGTPVDLHPNAAE